MSPQHTVPTPFGDCDVGTRRKGQKTEGKGCNLSDIQASNTADGRAPEDVPHLTDVTIPHALATLAKSDDGLAALIKEWGPPSRLIAKRGGCFTALVKSIMYQQLAGKAAACIHARFLQTCGVTDDQHLDPDHVLAADVAQLRAAGLSERKASYVRDLAQHFKDGKLSDQLLAGLSFPELVSALTAVRGVGPWTVDMFAMFQLGHPDVLPVGDLGVRKGMQLMYGLKSLPSPSEMEAVTQHWRPYRSIGSYYMWRIPCPPANKSKSGGSSSTSGTKRGRGSSSSNGSSSTRSKRMKGVQSTTATPKGTEECFAASGGQVDCTTTTTTTAPAAAAAPSAPDTAPAAATPPAVVAMAIDRLATAALGSGCPDDVGDAVGLKTTAAAGAAEMCTPPSPPAAAAAAAKACTPQPAQQAAAVAAPVKRRGRASPSATLPAIPLALNVAKQDMGTPSADGASYGRAGRAAAGGGGNKERALLASVDTHGPGDAGGSGACAPVAPRRTSSRLAVRARAAGGGGGAATALEPQFGAGLVGGAGQISLDGAEMLESTGVALEGEVNAGALQAGDVAEGRKGRMRGGGFTKGVSRVLREGWVPRELDF